MHWHCELFPQRKYRHWIEKNKTKSIHNFMLYQKFCLKQFATCKHGYVTWKAFSWKWVKYTARTPLFVLICKFTVRCFWCRSSSGSHIFSNSFVLVGVMVNPETILGPMLHEYTSVYCRAPSSLLFRPGKYSKVFESQNGWCFE